MTNAEVHRVSRGAMREAINLAQELADRVLALTTRAKRFETALLVLSQPPYWTGAAFPDCPETELEPTEWCSSCYARMALSNPDKVQQKAP